MQKTDYANIGGIARAEKLAVAPGAGIATAGYCGKAIVGDGGWATAGDIGYAVCGIGGKARGGRGATLSFTSADGTRIEKRVAEGEAYVFFTLHGHEVVPLHSLP